MTQWKTSKASLKDTQFVPCQFFLHRYDLYLETLIDAGEQLFKQLALNWARQMPSLYIWLIIMAIKPLWLKPDKYYVTQKGSHLTSVQSSITGLCSIRYSPLHITNSCYYPSRRKALGYFLFAYHVRLTSLLHEVKLYKMVTIISMIVPWNEQANESNLEKVILCWLSQVSWSSKAYSHSQTTCVAT